MTAQFKLARPVDEKFRVTQYFGENPDVYQKFGQAGHEGVDFGLPVGENIYACADGEVFDVRPDNSAYGIHVRVRHLFGGREYHTIYAHMSKSLVSKGQSVKAGDVLGLSGNTGHSFGPHLHFTLKLIGATTPGYPRNVVDPWPYLEGQPPAESKPLEPSDLTIYTTDKVRMRGGPTTASAEVAWLESGEALTVLGDANAARDKVGQSGQWIPARRADGTDGYVAAWYAQLKAAAAPPPAATLAPKPPDKPAPKPEAAPAGDFVVYATEPLNVREGPLATKTRTAIALPNEPLTVVGDIEEAKGNIGDRGDWLQVRLANSSKNYVAAWYVQTEPGPEPDLLLTVAPTEDMNMRERPTTAAPIVDRLIKNVPLTVHDDPKRAKALVGRQGEWLYVETPEKKRGWIAAWYAQVRPPSFAAPTLPPEPTEPVVVYAIETLHVHQGPSLDTEHVAIVLPHEPLTTLGSPRAALSRLGQQGEWLEVRLPDGSEGYVAAWLVQDEPGYEPALLLTVRPLMDMQMYTWPSTAAERVGQLTRDTSLTVHDDLERAEVLVGRLSEWLYVVTEEGERGWIPAWFLQAE